MWRRSGVTGVGLFGGQLDRDGLYLVAFYFCIGLLPGFITLVSDKALQIPFIVIALLSALQIFSNPSLGKRFLSEITKPYMLLLLAFCLLLGINAIWGIFQDISQSRIIQKPILVLFFTFLLGYTFLKYEDKNSLWLFRFLLIGTLLGLFFIAVETLGGYYFSGGEKSFFKLEKRVVDSGFSFLHIHKINRSLEVISVLIFVAGLGLIKGWNKFYFTSGLVIFIWLLSFVVLGAEPILERWRYASHITSETVQFGLPAALMVFIAAYKFPRLITNLVFGAICFVLLSAPWLFQLWYEYASLLKIPGILIFLVRAEIWEGVAETVLEAPFFGYGIDSVRYLQHVTLDGTYYTPEKLWHPHNMFLQVWLDIGFLGVLMVLGCIVCGWRAVRNLEPQKCAAALGSIVMLALFGLVTHSLWQTWSMALIGILSIIISAMVLSPWATNQK